MMILLNQRKETIISSIYKCITMNYLKDYTCGIIRVVSMINPFIDFFFLLLLWSNQIEKRDKMILFSIEFVIFVDFIQCISIYSSLVALYNSDKIHQYEIGDRISIILDRRINIDIKSIIYDLLCLISNILYDY